MMNVPSIECSLVGEDSGFVLSVGRGAGLSVEQRAEVLRGARLRI